MHGGDDGQARPQRCVFERFRRHRDADGDALHDLGEIARRIVGRQQRELRARSRRDRGDDAGNHPPAEGIDGEVDLLPGSDRIELRLLEIGVDIGAAQRNQREQPRAGQRVLAELDRLVADDAVEGGANFGEGKVAFGLFL